MSAIVQAVQANDTDSLAKLLRGGESPDGIDTTGESGLAIAAFLGDAECVRLLLEYGADPNLPGSTAWPLVNAAGQGHAEIVELLLDAGADVDAVDEEGGTSLIEAAAGGHLAVVELLIEAGADVRKRDHDHRRAISYAAEKGHREIVKLLRPNSTSADRREIDQLLGISQPKSRGELDPELLEAVYNGDVNAVQARLAVGADVNAPTSEGLTPVFIAAAQGHLGVLRALVEHGADVHHQSEDGDCALDYAAKSGHSAAFDYLLPLTKKGLREGAEWLRKNKILRGEWMWPRPDIDERYKKQSIDNRILREMFFCAKSASFPEAELELSKYLAQGDVPADLILSDGTTLLMSAAESNNLKLIKRLVEQYHLDPNVTNKFGSFALAIADRARARNPVEGQRVYDFLYPLTDAELRQRVDRVQKKGPISHSSTK